MRSRISLNALLALTLGAASLTLAPQASAQRRIIPPQNDPQSQMSRERLSPSHGRIDLRARTTQRRAIKAVPRVQRVVSRALTNPDTASFEDLRVGDYRQALVICGTVISLNANGERESRRFIGRSNIATLVSDQNSSAFRAGWRQTGCGV